MKAFVSRSRSRLLVVVASTGSRMRLLMRLVFLFALLTVVYQYSQCTRVSRLSGIDSEQHPINVRYSQWFKERRSVVREKLAPFNDIVGVASSNVAAYSNGNDSFYSNEDYSLYGVYMGLKWQCVEYARRWTFVRKGSVFSSVEGAKDMWNQLTYVQRVVDQQRFALTRHENGSPHPPRNESYLIYPQQKDMPFGHVSVIVQVLPRAIRVAEQNFYFTYWKHHYAREIPVTRRDGRYYIEDKYQVYGWMEIDDSDKQLKPLNQATIDMIELKHQQNRALVSSCRTVLSSDSFLLLLSFFVSHAIFF